MSRWAQGSGVCDRSERLLLTAENKCMYCILNFYFLSCLHPLRSLLQYAMSHHLGPLSWLQTLAFLLLLRFAHAAVKPVIGLSCQANDATISAIQNSIGNPQDFCTWYNAANRKYSPILGLSGSEVRQACKCIKANPAVLGSHEEPDLQA